MNVRSHVALLLCLLTALLVAPPALAGKKIESITDLPVRTYPTDVAPSQMLADAALMDALRGDVEKDIERVLDKYDLEDAATLRRF